MNELRALVEKGGVVVVAFDHEIFRVIEAGALSQIGRNAADHITWFEPGRFQDPSQQRGGGCFSVRPSDDQIFATTQEKLLQHRLRAITFTERDVSPADLFHRTIVDEPLAGACRGVLCLDLGLFSIIRAVLTKTEK